MDIDLLRGLALVLLIVAFIAVCVWACETGDTERERSEDERHDDHEQHAEEDLTDGLRHVSDDRVDPRCAVREQVRADAGRRSEREAEQYPGVERDTAALLAGTGTLVRTTLISMHGRLHRIVVAEPKNAASGRTRRASLLFRIHQALEA
jgi:hypothetical protein